MKVGFACDSNEGLNSKISAHFGRAPYFIIVEIEKNKEPKYLKTVKNPAIEEHQPGEIPSLMLREGVELMVSGGMGSRAQEYFSSRNVKVITGKEGKIIDVIKEII
ncbi:MAG: dinitrogenase iron-molybdenum cofactor biosynthesis protein [Deltaproteobacteria bacterium]|nr:MAG: dinitrogenase iron-molybdenum cofactor biosynthesis protein [Deltaproteobacteria bacterium]